MPRKITPASVTEVARALDALEHLQKARDLLKAAGAVRALGRVRLAITSTGGAVRHARNRRDRTEAL